MSLKLVEKTAEVAADKQVATFELLLDDDRTRITQWTIAPGEQTGWHLHDYDYVTIQQSTGRLHLEFADGSVKEIDYVPGTAKLYSAPIEHNATNIGDVDIRVLEIEYKN
ncbi:MAG: cupin [Alphaproteobacteria bacterium]|jgi:quercetin dioxygenase-like cupin family protein